MYGIQNKLRFFFQRVVHYVVIVACIPSLLSVIATFVDDGMPTIAICF